MHFSAKCNSGRIAIQWFHITRYLDYQYTKFQPYTFRVQKKCVFLHDTRLWFPDYNIKHPQKSSENAVCFSRLLHVFASIILLMYV